MKWLFRATFILCLLFLTAVVFVYFINDHIQTIGKAGVKESIVQVAEENPPRVAIVFGAGVWRGGEPSPALYDRILTGVELYRAGRVRKLLMSGDNRVENYNEPKVMKETAVKLGVPPENIVEDFAGRRTYDTCYRAREIFGVTRAVLVTQEFHLPRALYLCNAFGIDGIGVKADRRNYQSDSYWDFRESFANASAWFDVNFYQPKPILGNQEPIEP